MSLDNPRLHRIGTGNIAIVMLFVSGFRPPEPEIKPINFKALVPPKKYLKYKNSSKGENKKPWKKKKYINY